VRLVRVPTSVDSARGRPRAGRDGWGDRLAARVVEEVSVLAGGRLRPTTAARLRDVTSGGYRVFLAVLDGDEEAGSPARMAELVRGLFDGFDVSLEDAMALHRHLEQVLVADASKAAPFAAIDPDLLQSLAHRFFNDLAVALTDAYLASRRADDRNRDVAESELLACLLMSPPRLGEARRLARGFDVELDGGWEVAVLSPLDPGERIDTGRVAGLRRALRGAVVLVGTCDAGVVVAVRPTGAAVDWPEPGPGLVCGVGCAHSDARGLRESHGEALEALGVARRKAQPIVRFDDAWFDRFLLGAVSAQELAELVLAPVATLTPNRRAVVLETLEAYLDSGSSVGAVADALHLHRQSVNYRMQHVRRLFGPRLMSANGRLALHIAVKAARLPAT
jgi:hypothetical protein